MASLEKELDKMVLKNKLHLKNPDVNSNQKQKNLKNILYLKIKKFPSKYLIKSNKILKITTKNYLFF